MVGRGVQVKNDILGLNIPMHDLPGMHVLHSSRNLLKDTPDVIFGQLTHPFVQILQEIFLENISDYSDGVALSINIVRREYVRMI